MLTSVFGSSHHSFAALLLQADCVAGEQSGTVLDQACLCSTTVSTPPGVLWLLGADAHLHIPQLECIVDVFCCQLCALCMLGKLQSLLQRYTHG